MAVNRIIDLTVKIGSASGQANLLRAKGLREFKTQLEKRARDISKDTLKRISEDMGEEAAKVVRRRLATATLAFFRASVRGMFEIPDGRADFSVTTKGILAYFPDRSTVVWEGLSAAYSRRKRRNGKPREFFVFNGDLRTQLTGSLPDDIVRRIPDVKIFVVPSETPTGPRYEVVVKLARSPLFGYGLGRKTLGAQASDRKLQGDLLRRLGFNTSGDIFHKLQNRNSDFRPTVLLMIQHWYTFVLPRVLTSAVTEVANRTGRRRGTSGRGDSKLEGFG